MPQLTKEEFGEWLRHPGTLALREWLAGEREELRQEWEGGSYTDYTTEATVLKNVFNTGVCKGLARCEAFDWETYEGARSGNT